MTVGTVVQHFNEYRESIVTVSGITAAGTTPSFRSRALIAGSFMVTGTWATSASTTVQLQGSNDNTNYVNIGVPLTASSGGTTPQAGSVSPEGFFFSFYQFVVTGGDGGTAITIQLRLASPNV